MEDMLEIGPSEDDFEVRRHPKLLLEKPRSLPLDLLNNLKTLQELSTLRKEAYVNLKDLNNLSALCEIEEKEIHESQIKVKAKEHEILKAVLEISIERRKLCEGEVNEDCIHLDREMSEMESASPMFEIGEAKGKFLLPSSCPSKNGKVGKIVANAIKWNSALVTEEVPMEMVESLPLSTVGILSPDGRHLLPERLEMIQSEESELVEEEKKAAEKMKVAHVEQLSFTTRHLNDLRKTEKSLESVVKVFEAHVDLSEKGDDSDQNNFLIENLLFKRLLLKVVRNVIKFADFNDRVKLKRIALNYNLNLFEPRLKLLKEIKFLTAKRQSYRGSRWTEVAGHDFHHDKLADSSAGGQLSDDNLTGLDRYLFYSIH